MALDIPLPRQILTHAHWTLGHEKMSKSTGNVVNPFFALDRFGVDAMRYYLIHDGGIRDDADYENSHIIERYKKGLKGGLGNLASRVLRGKNWSVQEAVLAATQGDAPADSRAAADHHNLLVKLPAKVEMRMGYLDAGAALQDIMNAVYQVSNATWALKQCILTIEHRQIGTSAILSHGIWSKTQRSQRTFSASSTFARNPSASAASCSNPTCRTR